MTPPKEDVEKLSSSESRKLNRLISDLEETTVPGLSELEELPEGVTVEEAEGIGPDDDPHLPDDEEEVTS